MSEEITHEEENPVKSVIWMYGALIAVTLLCFVPDMAFAIVSMIFLMFLLIAAYVMRGRAKEDVFTASHMTWIIRTVSFSCIFILVTASMGSVYLWLNIDKSSMDICFSRLGDYIMSGHADAGAIEMWAVLKPCYGNFIQDNLSAIIIASVIAGGPIVFFIIERIIKGLICAGKGLPLTNPKSFF